MARRSPKSPSSPPIPSARANPWKLRALTAVIIAGIAMAAGFYAMQPPAPRPPSAADALIGGPPGRTQNPQPKNPTSLTHNPEPATQNAKLRPPLPDAQVYAPFPDGTKIAAPVTLSAADAPIGGPHPSAAPTSLAPAQLTVGDPANADPMEFAFHPSRFSDPSRTAKSVAPVILSAADPSAADAPIGGPTSPTQPSGHKPQAPVDPYPEALRLERARAFAMSMCLDTQGRLWVGSENTTPGDGTGGVQCYDPSKPPLEAFTQYLSDDSANKLNTQHPELRNSIQGGLGDDNAYALACDHQGRIWVGHLNHGISVFNGEKWQNYEVVAGLSIPTSLNGPLGERIFKIVVSPEFGGKQEAGSKKQEEPVFHDSLTGKDSPISGSVWMCTSAGLAVYFPSTDTWSYITRAEGMPSDQANSLAFGPDGSVYVASQCDGIFIARPADHYASWKQVARRASDVARESALPNSQPPSPDTLSDDLPTTASGSGLPTNLMNDILIAKDGTIYAATTTGLVWSRDRGETWNYRRGADYADKVRQSSSGPPKGWTETRGSTLTEDFCTAMAADAAGDLWVGYRNSGVSNLKTAQQLRAFDGKVTATLSGSTTGPLALGSFGGGVSVFQRTEISTQIAVPPALPSGASAPELEALHRVATQPKLIPDKWITLLRDDWLTQGDWVGRYGRQSATLCAHSCPFDVVLKSAPYFGETEHSGTHVQPSDSLRRWLAADISDSPGALWDPLRGCRRDGQWDDHGESYPATWEGPDIAIDIPVPLGIFRITLYFYDDNSHNHGQNGRFRDLYIRARRAGDQSAEPVACRVQSFAGGVYKQFVVRGGATYHFEVRRNYGLNAFVNGVFIDRLAGPGEPEEAMGLVALGGTRYGPPTAASSLNNSATAGETDLWNRTLPEINRSPTEIARGQTVRQMIYRRASATDADQKLLANWRWSFPMLTASDREECLQMMKQGSERFRAQAAAEPRF